MTLLQKLMAILSGGHTMEAALTHFNRAIDKLEAFIQQEQQNVVAKAIDIAQAQADKSMSERNAAQARNKLAKLKALVGDDHDFDQPESPAPAADTAKAVEILRAVQ
ncbi:hypothetical protein [Herbaspirillum huttiense]|uniref:Uncharacterized protein n=1 Tax=Herbaspirillum huttiense subsp. lycopersici TaxID=3074428 RepID=A0ABU2EG49_9BURK|nr:hypothetical protein [Herbaspirillum huttiense]MDR9847101.1 hypothetical protein [Herbaspirillum huttiense SE1]